MLKAPYPYFGGKNWIANEVWARFGNPPNYVEPFFGSGAVLLARPGGGNGRTETVNDLDGFVANFWRALQADSDQVAYYADWPVNENDLHARHAWLVGQRDSMQAKLESDPEWCDPKIAGWWVWGMSIWIGSGFCSGSMSRQRPCVGDSGRGVHRKCKTCRTLPSLGRGGSGVHRKTLGSAGRGFEKHNDLAEYMEALKVRMRRVRVCCGDWARVCGFTPTTHQGLTGMFLDPPYSADAGRAACYAKEDFAVAHDVRAYALEHGDDPKMRIALCGYDVEHGDKMPDTWECFAWKTKGGYGSQGAKAGLENCHRERIWFSPHCLKPAISGIQETMFEEETEQ